MIVGLCSIVASNALQTVGAFTIFSDEVGPQIWEGFLSKALRAGTVIPKPDPMIVGEELRSVQLGLDTQKRGVSARKVVVTNSKLISPNIQKENRTNQSH